MDPGRASASVTPACRFQKSSGADPAIAREVGWFSEPKEIFFFTNK